MIYILLILLIIQFIISYYIFDKNLFSPSAIICEVFILSTLACIFNVKKWGVNLHISTLLVILVGNFVFIFTSYLVHKKMKKKKDEAQSDDSSELNYIEISNFKCIVLVLVYVLFAIMYIKVNRAYLASLNFNGEEISFEMNMYRNAFTSGKMRLPGYLTRIGAILNIGSFILIYVFINNVIVNPQKIKNYILFICPISYLISSIFTAQRTTILLAFLYSIFVTYELLNRKYRFTSKLNSKYILLGGLSVVVFLLLFGITRGIFGRIDENSILDNVTYYMGNSIESLDLYIQKPIKCNQFGEELFREFRERLSALGVCDKPDKELFMEFRRDARGNVAGNIYTAYRNYIHDFGYGSIFIFQIILALFYGIWYEKINNRKLDKNIDLSFVMYAWFILCLFRFSLTNTFFTYLAYFVFTHWYVFVIWKILLTTKIKINERRI